MTEDLLPGGARALASAFFRDPLLSYLIPSDETRRVALPHLMEANLRLTLPERETYALLEDGRVIGAIGAEPPGKYPYPVMRELLFNWRIFWRPNPWTPPPARFLRVLSYTGLWTRMHPREPHWYIYIVGVEVERHGKGHGRRLMEHIHARADAAGRICYLETQTEGNVPFYKRLGFEVTETHRPRADGPPTWGLLRRAKGPDQSQSMQTS